MSQTENSPSAPFAAPRKRPDGWWYPWIFVAAFLVVVAVNAVMISIAVGTFTGLETSDHFRKGVTYNQALEGARAQAALGWRDTLTFSADDTAAHGGLIDVRFTDEAGNAVTGLDVKALIVRPVQDGYDSEVALPHLGAGRYAARIEVPLPGLWEIRLLAYGPKGADYQAVHRITVK